MDIRSPRLLYLKGALFLLLSLLASALLLVEHFTLQHTALLLIALWSACRAYYFVFYVIQHYIDPGYRFAGLLDFAKYLLHTRRPQLHAPSDPLSHPSTKMPPE